MNLTDIFCLSSENKAINIQTKQIRIEALEITYQKCDYFRVKLLFLNKPIHLQLLKFS